MPRIRYWTKSSAKGFWRKRDRVCILAHCHSEESSLLQLQRKREEAFETQKAEYYASLAETEEENEDDDHLHAHEISKDLAFWIKYLSWTYCEVCNILTRKALPHNFRKKTITTAEQCICAKISFMTKVFSLIVDYAMLFELLLFQYDRWLFKTVTGAINSARALKCSPMRALDTKTFSPGYWQWQHLFLLGAVHQFGFPSVFVTISPFEWTFPFPYWLNKIRRSVGVGKTYLPAYETIHIANVLEQLVRGYLCGSNSARWSDHLFQQDMPLAEKNVLTYFYRFEF